MAESLPIVQNSTYNIEVATVVQPIDYTESSPRALVQGQGALGV